MIQPIGKVAIGVFVAATVVVAGVFAVSNSQANYGSSNNPVVISTTQTITSTTTVSNGPMTLPGTSTSCGTITGTGGPVYLKVTSDDGLPITNGSVLVGHYAPAVNGVGCVDKTYRVPLKPFTDGYTVVSINDSLPLAGNYNLSLTVGYGGNKTFTAGLPFVRIPPVTPVYIIVKVPLGAITISNCLDGGCVTTSMTTTVRTTSGR